MSRTPRKRTPRNCAVRAEDLDPLDLFVLQEVVRFGWLACDQIARRYPPLPRGPKERIRYLESVDVLKRWDRAGAVARPIYMATPVGARLTKQGLTPPSATSNTVFHHLTVVDIADRLVADEQGTIWFTEREYVGWRNRRLRRFRNFERGHQPDGLLFDPDRMYVGVEVELHWVNATKYADICQWFAAQPEINRLRWFVPTPRLRERIAKVVVDYGLRLDLDITVELFPAGVVVRD